MTVDSESAKLRKALLRWYRRAARDLPWRRTRDPYAIWVSEIMLQQTRVDTVIPYYQRFVERFPTPQHLADAPEDDVMALWSGLGYYRRARQLHKGVREVVASYGGQVPKGRTERLGLPGVGPYTAGAIGSIAFDEPEPIVDGNVARVLCRLDGIDGPPNAKETKARLWQRAEELAQGPKPGDLNQALMELGATVCTPKQPNCSACPVRAHCVALQSARVDALPKTAPKKRPVPMRLAVVVAERSDGAIWLVRQEGTLFGGLFALPTRSIDDDPRTAAKLALASNRIKATLQASAPKSMRHTLTHRRLEVSVFRATKATARPTQSRRCIPLNKLHKLGIATLTSKAIGHASATPNGR